MDTRAVESAFLPFLERARATLSWTFDTSSLNEILCDLPRYTQIRRLVHDLENSNEFTQLIEATAGCFGEPSKRISRAWTGAIHSFFAQSGIYGSLFDGRAVDPSKCLTGYMDQFSSVEHDVLYLLPLEGVSLACNTLDFGDCFIRHYSEAELKELVRWDAQCDFYTAPESNWAAFASGFWFFCVHGRKRARKRGIIAYGQSSYVPTVPVFFSLEISSALEVLALFDWRPPWLKFNSGGDLQEASSPMAELGIPFVLEVPHDLTDWPPRLPRLSSIHVEVESLDPDDAEVAIPFAYLPLNSERTAELRGFSKIGDKLKEIYNCDCIETVFLKTALGFFRAGAMDASFSGFLWNLSALEALFGEKSSVTESVARRLVTVYWGDDQRKGTAKKKFRDLYDIRSKVLHGDREFSEVSSFDVAIARILARDAILYSIDVLHGVALSLTKQAGTGTKFTRRHFLQVTEMSPDDRHVLLKVLPSVD